MTNENDLGPSLKQETVLPEEVPAGESNNRKRRESSNRTEQNSHRNGEKSTADAFRTEFNVEKDDMDASVILSMLDIESYEEAAWEDADLMVKNHLLPKSLPWSKPRVPLLRSLPRDIEDMQGVLHAGEDEEGDVYRKDFNSGPFGYGMFDMGGLSKEDVKGGLAHTSVATIPINSAIDKKLPKCGSSPDDITTDHAFADHSDDEDQQTEYEAEAGFLSHCINAFTAAARRSVHPGIIELTVKLPLPSLALCLIHCQNHNIIPRNNWLKHDKKSITDAKSLLQAERAEACSCMPLYWKKIDHGCFEEPPAFIDLSNEETTMSIQSASTSIYAHMKMRERRKRKIEAMSKACTRKWRVSVKVASVSSRPTLFRREMKHMYLKAELPSYVQSGKSVTIESALIKDREEGERGSLGSYDCRATSTTPTMSYEAMDTANMKTSKGRSKRINVGRTRLIWTTVSMPNTKPSFASILTGEKLDASSYKRPKSVVVAIRLNGTIISEPKQIDEDTKRSSDASEKYTWSKSKVHNALENIPNEKPTTVVNAPSKANDQSPTGLCTIDLEDYFQTIVPRHSQMWKKAKQSDFHISTIRLSAETSILRKLKKPRIHCIPLEDGFVRVQCLAPGVLDGSLIYPATLSDVAKLNEGDPLCTICWTGSEKNKVLRCKFCNLCAHKECCLDPGKMILSGFAWTCAKCIGTPYEEHLPKLQKVAPSPQKTPSTDNVQGAPATGSRKSQRKTKLPTRFKENALEVDIIPTMNASRSLLQKEPKCTLCPHSGGAMSITQEGKDGAHQRWTHEVCRIWCGSSIPMNSEPSSLDINLKCAPVNKSTTTNNNSHHVLPEDHPLRDVVCSLCGMGQIHNQGKSNEEVLNVPPVSASIKESLAAMGLLRCAATGCGIYFHPMCALMYTKLSQEYCDYLRRRQTTAGRPREDEFQSSECDDYTLDFIQVSRKEETAAAADESEASSSRQTYIVPVGYCGLHNPSRAADLYGMPPMGSVEFQTISNLMQIPYQLS